MGSRASDTLPYSVEQMQFLVSNIGKVLTAQDRAYIALHVNVNEKVSHSAHENLSHSVMACPVRQIAACRNLRSYPKHGTGRSVCQ